MSSNEVEATFGRIQPGVQVDIKRSNGQTQHAIVSGVDLETRTVSVTWSEEGEIRGKELFLEDLLTMNPQLATTNEPANASQQPTHQESLELPRPDRTTDLVDSHCNLGVQFRQWVNNHASLLATTTKVNFDPNGYTNALGAMINKNLEALLTMQERLRRFDDQN